MFSITKKTKYWFNFEIKRFPNIILPPFIDVFYSLQTYKISLQKLFKWLKKIEKSQPKTVNSIDYIGETK